MSLLILGSSPERHARPPARRIELDREAARRPNGPRPPEWPASRPPCRIWSPSTDSAAHICAHTRRLVFGYAPSTSRVHQRTVTVPKHEPLCWYAHQPTPIRSLNAAFTHPYAGLQPRRPRLRVAYVPLQRHRNAAKLPLPYVHPTTAPTLTEKQYSQPVFPVNDAALLPPEF